MIDMMQLTKEKFLDLYQTIDLTKERVSILSSRKDNDYDRELLSMMHAMLDLIESLTEEIRTIQSVLY